MSKRQLKINILTKLKMSLGINTKSDEINTELKDLKNQKKKVAEKIETTDWDLSKVEQIIVNIDKIYNIAENDILNGKIDELSSKIISYQLSVKRAKRQKVDINKIVEMQKKYQKVQDSCIEEYINSIINEKKYQNGNYNEIKILINEIINNIKRMNLNYNISVCEDLIKLKDYMLNKRMNIISTRNDYLKIDSSIRSAIYEIEMSEEKKIADKAVEIANSKRKR